MTEIHFYEPSQGHRLPHNPFKAIIAPRPIGWISTVDAAGVPNLAPYSFFNAIADDPPMLAFCSDGWKDSVANCEATREFVWNLATKDLADAMNGTSASLPPEADEFITAGVASAPSRIVRPLRVADSPAAMECKVADIHRLRDASGRVLDRWMVLGEVVGVHIDPAYLDADGLYDTAKARPIMRGGYMADYVEITPAAMFRMRRPR